MVVPAVFERKAVLLLSKPLDPGLPYRSLLMYIRRCLHVHGEAGLAEIVGHQPTVHRLLLYKRTLRRFRQTSFNWSFLELNIVRIFLIL